MTDTQRLEWLATSGLIESFPNVHYGVLAMCARDPQAEDLTAEDSLNGFRAWIDHQMERGDDDLSK